MNTGLNSSADEPELMIEMNTTPLIDVMLVLLVMLIITIPIQWHAVNMNLPVGPPPAVAVVPDRIQIDIDAQSVVSWQGVVVSDSEFELKMTAAGRQANQPSIQIRPDRLARYATFARVLAASRRSGLSQVAVIGSEQFLQ